MSESLHVIALAQSTDDGADLPEMPVLYTGTFEHGGRTIPVTEADLDQAVENFNAQLAAGTEIPVDYEHGKAEGGIASGWYKALRREGNRLLAKIAWTDKAREQIKAGARKYFSPEFALASKDEKGTPTGFRLLAGALVVRPHLKGLGAVAMTEDARAALADEDYVVVLSASPTPTPKDAPDMADTVSLKDHEELAAKLSEASEQITALSERVTAAEDRAEQAEAKHAETAKALFSEQLDRTLTQARREGRIDAKDETTAKWTERAEKHGIDFVAELLADIPAETIPMSEQGHGADQPLDTVDAPEGVDPLSHKAAKLAEKYEADGLSFEEATSKAYKEVYA